ncbi:MAG: putative nucleotide-diphospho-sugar transferase [Steroidobacteraceae bacterium]
MLIRFLSGIEDGLRVHHLELPVAGLKSAPAGGGIATWEYKTKLLIELASGDPKNIVLLTDIDIEFYRPIAPLITEMLDTTDLLFQRERSKGSEVNIGVIAFRPSQELAHFWEQVLKRVLVSQTWDQTITNEVLADSGYMSQSGLRVGLLPHTVCNLSQQTDYLPYGNAILFHANKHGVKTKWHAMNHWRPILSACRGDLERLLFMRNLYRLSWRFGRVDSGAAFGKIVFNSNGTIENYDHPNERRFEVRSNGLCFFDAAGRCSTFFNEFYYDCFRQKLMAVGTFELEPASERTLHYLIGSLSGGE